METLYTVSQVANMLGVSAPWVRREAASVGAQRVGRDWVITAAQVESLRAKIKPVGRTRKMNCYDEQAKVYYPSHEVTDDGECLHCHSWFGWQENDEVDTSVAYATQDERDAARWGARE